MNHDLLMRLISGSILAVSAILPAVAQDDSEEDTDGEMTTTLTDDVATLDVTTVGADSARSVVIREEAVQRERTPEVVTKTPKPEEEHDELLPSVDTISGAEIRSHQRYEVEDILRQSAGVHVVQAGQAGAQTSLFVRGMESNHTVVLLNGRRLPPGLAGLYQLEYLDTSTLESVQFTRGAASSLYGSDAMAGAIDLRSTDARWVKKNTVSSQVEGGSFSTLRTGHQVTLREGRVGISIDASHHETENDRPRSDFDNGVIRGNAAVTLGDRVHFDVLGYVQDSFLEVPGSSLNPDFPQDQINKNDSALISPRFSIQRDDWDFSAFYSYTSNELQATRDPFFNDNLLDQTGHEFEAVFNFHPTDRGTYTLGGGYYEYEFERIPLIPGPFNQPADFGYGFGGVFGQIDQELPANLHFLGSARYDDHDSFESKGTYTAQLSHRVEATGTTLFGKIATGYKAPSGQDFIFLAPTVDPTTIDPEESLTHEIGLRQTIFNPRSSLSVTYFQNEVDDLVDVDPFTFVTPAVVDTETSGFEGELELSPREGVRFYANYTYLDTEIIEGQYFGGFGGGPGDRLPRRPRHTLSGGLVLTGDAWEFGAEITGAYDRLDAPGVFLDDYTVARFFGTVDLTEDLQIYGRIDNAFDTEYESTTGFEASGFGAFAGVRLYLGGGYPSTPGGK